MLTQFIDTYCHEVIITVYMYVSKGIINCIIMWFSSLNVSGGLSISFAVTFTILKNFFCYVFLDSWNNITCINTIIHNPRHYY